jgi:hypothetical protein
MWEGVICVAWPRSPFSQNQIQTPDTAALTNEPSLAGNPTPGRSARRLGHASEAAAAAQRICAPLRVAGALLARMHLCMTTR